MSHLLQLPVVAVRASCMEGSSAAGMEWCGKQGSMGEWCRWALPVRAAGAFAGVAAGIGARTWASTQTSCSTTASAADINILL